ncbi:MAG: hypothetical protein JWO36_4085 [Myxococcales bacterium]|nr:hypothetical protein [Myxococcales bacterium]
MSNDRDGMFDRIKKLFGKSDKPAPLPDFTAFPNPGIGSRLTVAFASDLRTWEEKVDLVDLLATSVAESLGPCECEDDRLAVANGLILKPQLVSFKPPAEGEEIRTSTTIEVSHPHFGVGAVFEWQHSTGATLSDAITSGFAEWAQVDLRALIEAVKSDALELTYLTFGMPGRGRRRVVLSPVIGVFSDTSSDGEHASGCPCCMFSGCINTMHAVLDSDRLYGVRLYAARMPGGEVMADCRINGADFPAGAAALRRYAASWPGDGVETRKQYVVVQTDPKESGLASSP